MAGRAANLVFASRRPIGRTPAPLPLFPTLTMAETTPFANQGASPAIAVDPTTERLSFLEKFGFGVGDLASNLLFQTFNMFLLFFYTDVVGLGTIAIWGDLPRRQSLGHGERPDDGGDRRSHAVAVGPLPALHLRVGDPVWHQRLPAFHGPGHLADREDLLLRAHLHHRDHGLHGNQHPVLRVDGRHHAEHPGAHRRSRNTASSWHSRASS